MDVSIIVVSYNTKDKTVRCIDSVIEQTKGLDYEIIIVDNGSTDGSIEALEAYCSLPNYLLIKLGKNVGFGRANNRGLEEAKGKYIFYLNNDTILLNNAVKMFFDYYEEHPNEKIGALGGYLKDIDRNETHSFGVFPTYKALCRRAFKDLFLNLVKSILSLFGLMKIYKKAGSQVLQAQGTHEEPDKTIDVDYITGADLFVQNNDMARFDEAFFMYYEESDLEYKMQQKNLRRTIIPGPQIIHDQAVSGANVIYKVTDVFKDLSSVIYARKHLSPNAYFLRSVSFLSLRVPGVRKIYHRALQIIRDAE